ncbi:MAG: peroxiredoxin [Sphingomonas phyllosphaerae]|uniref:peroxiredoxin n=1 Tax=Sphingomonas phyllosphaerae TaxID=257003 RepID=UPI002FFBF849
MAIGVGDPLPSVQLTKLTPDGREPVDTAEFFKGRRVALFAVPGAYTPTCSAKHLPGFVEKADALKEKGIDEIACTAVNDPFVLEAWAKANDAQGVTMLADGNADFATALGLDMDGTKFGMGRRSQRYAMIVDDGKIESLHVEAPGEFRVSSADHLLATL